MPQFIEQKLKTQALKKGLRGKEVDKYTYGVLSNMGAMRGNVKTKKGERMQEKHEDDIGKKMPLKKLMKKGM